MMALLRVAVLAGGGLVAAVCFLNARGRHDR